MVESTNTSVDPWVVLSKRLVDEVIQIVKSLGAGRVMRSTAPVPRKEVPSFVPLDSRVCQAIATAAGIDTSKTLSMALEFSAPGEAYITARYLVTETVMVRMLEELRSIPTRE